MKMNCRAMSTRRKCWNYYHQSVKVVIPNVRYDTWTIEDKSPIMPCKPLFYCVLLILAVECFEKFSFYSICYTQTMYLTGVYNADWNAGLTSVDAASFVAISTAVAYTTTFVGATLADGVWGEYTTILVGALGLYIPGLLLLALTTVPYLLGQEFNHALLSLALLLLWPLGTGIVKSTVNVFGAKNFHPLLQSALIERYYGTSAFFGKSISFTRL